MLVNLSNPRPIRDDAEWLETLQGNILKFHGRDHAAHIFFAFRDRATAKPALREVRGYVTSAKAQDGQKRRRRDGPGELFGSLVLSASGLGKLGVLPAGFLAGMQADETVAALGDPALSTWEPVFRDHTFDGMLLLAHSDRNALNTAVGDASNRLAPHCTEPIPPPEFATKMVRDNLGIEHFGFADGRSQPLYLESDFIDEHGNAKEPSTANWRPFEPLRRVLIPDPLVPDDPRCHGSFLVFRKLEQNVRDFRKALVELSRRLAPEDVERAGALVVGRFRDGTPVMLSDRALGRTLPDNDFTYEDDPRGRRCPLQAHVRKVNPRGHTAIVQPHGRPLQDPDGERERQRRITRRSLPYGDQVPDDAPIESISPGGRGVLFMCYQANVMEQFGFMQRRWANEDDFPQRDIGPDALIGEGERGPYLWPAAHGSPAPKVPCAFAQFVHLRGGEFFYAPSKTYFDNL